MENTIKDRLVALFQSWSNESADAIVAMPQSGSDRKYFRIQSANHKVVGVHNPDKKENLAFIRFTEHFTEEQLAVPKILEQDLAQDIYLLQDLGDTTLFAWLTQQRAVNGFSPKAVEVYKKVIEQLPRFQLQAGQGLDYSYCYPRASFDIQSMMWDLNYFKYYFLKLAQIPFDEQKLEDDFQRFTDYLLQAPADYFLYRDFQSRNIMLVNEKPFFIDYQGGRKGALQYDLASLLYDAKADIPQTVREELLEYYLDVLEQHSQVDRESFKNFYYAYVLIRIMQAMGAYGFRGFYEKKTHFLQSIPFAIQNLKWILENVKLPIELPTLQRVWQLLTESEKLQQIAVQKEKLTVGVNSFSFKRGVPIDESGNGGGFVFDCRALPNPGRYEQYKQQTGMDAPVIEFLEKEEEVDRFLQQIIPLCEQSVNKYLERNFSSLMINFGCTGGQHRSVYCAEYLAKFLNKKYNVNVVLRHREQELKN